MHSRSFAQSSRELTAIAKEAELPGDLKVPDHPKITAGYANIYCGVWQGPDGRQIKVAVKEFKQLVPRTRQSDPNALKLKADRRIRREVGVWEKIDHPNVHSFLGYRSDPQPRLISVWCRHGNLKDYVLGNPDLSRVDKLRLIYQAGCGLEHLHSLTPPICHGDIKPQNVLITDVLEAALTDFGLSRVLHDIGESSELSTSGAMKGTLPYMAVELLRDEKARPTIESDVYAFGGLILAVMSGKPPFWGLHETAIMRRVMQNELPNPDDYQEILPSDPLWSLMRRCWNKTFASRPTIRDILCELWGYINPEEFNPWSRRTRPLVLENNRSGSSDALPDAPVEPSQTGTPAAPPVSVDQGQIQHTIGGEGLSAARRVFKSARVHARGISGIGRYIEATAEIGLTLVDIVQTAISNDTFKKLGSEMWNLAVFLEHLHEQSIQREEGWIFVCITKIFRDLRVMRNLIKELDSTGIFQNDLATRQAVDDVRMCQEAARKAVEETQLLVNLNAASLISEFENAELQKQHRRLLNRLGDGKYGAQGNNIQDVVCLPGTRVETLQRIEKWIRDTTTPDRVLWIRGMAGRGKSTIASTVVQKWKRRASCAIFHFRRGQSALSARMICAVARQLGSSIVPEVRNSILSILQENEDIADQRLEEQFETLFVAPLAKVNKQPHPVLIVVDALDECHNLTAAVDFVKLIDRYSSAFPPNVKFLLTCRPEAPLLRNLEPRRWNSLNLDTVSDVTQDLERFVRQACSEIKSLNPDIPKSWPSPGDIGRLVEMSQGLFQWASTAITYVSNGSPVDRLRTLLQRSSILGGLDDLYHQILSKAFECLTVDSVRQDIVCQVLGTLVVAPYPVSLEVISTLFGKHEIFEGVNREDIMSFLRRDILADFNSLLYIPSSPFEPMRLMHTSIHDLLVDKQRCRQQGYYIDVARYHQQLAGLCLTNMIESLRENICGLSDISKASLEAQDVVEQEVSKALQYCSRAWSIHLTEGVAWSKHRKDITIAELKYFEAFSKGKIMCWLEVMSLVGATTDAIIAAKHVHRWLLQRPTDVMKYDPLAALWNDVQRFVTTFWEPVSFGPLHIYISALPHCPTETEMWSLYGKHARVRMLHGDRMSRWPSNLWTQSASAKVKTVAFSPDGKVVAFGSSDKTIRLLDARTGAPVGEPLIGHTKTVWSVCFSPDGRFLASGSDDETVRLWDAETLAAVGDPLTGHDGGVNSVCFLPNGKVVASGSDDTTVRLWSAETGAAMGGPLTGHSKSVWSICFSQDGKLLASGSQDKTIRLWDPLAVVALGQPLTGHTDTVRSVCFSPDGNLLASGAEDGTIRLWNPESQIAVGEPLSRLSCGIGSVRFLPDSNILASGGGDGTIQLWDTLTPSTRGEPLTGHSAWVGSVCFSPDGKLLASGSDDETVRLWDPQAGAAVAGSLITHSAKVDSVCFSPDGKRVASVYDENSIRLWDPQTGAAVGEPLTGHSDKANSVCFSPDGKLLASGSNDCKIRLWDAQTGVAVGGPLKGHGDWVRSVCFSPDGRYLASGSDDKTIRLWDPQTRLAVGEPLIGHRDYVRSVCFSPDGKYLASGSEDKTIRLWDPQARAAVGEPLGGHSDYVISVSFSSDGTLLMARCDDGSLATWDVTTRQRCDTPRSHPFYTTPRFRDHWITFGSSRLLWLPPQYWNSRDDGVALFGGHLAAFQNGSLSILDVSEILGTLNN